MFLAGCGRCMTCNAFMCIQYRIFWPGFTDTCTYFMLARENMNMMIMLSKESDWMDKKQETSFLTKKRNVKLSLKIPAVLGTGLVNDKMLYVRAIDISTARFKSQETSSR